MNITIDNIDFSYNGTPVLKNISCSINPGDFVSLVGPNGSGKSTLIKCVTGILKPQAGQIRLNQSSSSDELIRAHHLAYVPQNENRNTGLTVFDTVLLGRKPYISWKPSETDLEITARVIESLHLNDVVMKPINKLSGGQQQTVFIARALAQEPRVLLLDEPTANLDLKHQIEVLELLKKLSGQGITIFLALHDINLALRYTQKIMMLKNGSIVGFGGLEIVNEQQMADLYDIDVKIIRNECGTFIMPYGLKEE